MAEGELNIGPLPSIRKLLKDGYHKTYNENKDILMDGEFQKGKLWTGKHYIYDENGLLERIDVYKEGSFLVKGYFKKLKRKLLDSFFICFKIIFFAFKIIFPSSF